MRKMSIKSLFLNAFVLLFFSSTIFAQVHDREEFDRVGKAIGYWLKDKTLAQVAVLKMDKEVRVFNSAAIVMMHRFLEESNSGWELYHRASYDKFGREIPLVESTIQTHKDGQTQRVMTSGYYFIKKTEGKQEFRLAVTPLNEYVNYPGDGYAVDDYLNAAYRRDLKQGFISFRKDFYDFVQGNLLYRYSVLDFNSEMQIKYLENVENMGISWDQLILDDRFKANLRKQTQGYVELIEHFKKLNIHTKKGLLLEGPPGTGKSLLGQILVSSIQEGNLKDKATLLLVTARHLQTRNAVRRLFDAARDLSPSVVFMEDIDLLGIQSRDGLKSDDMKDDILNEFLNGIDGVVENDGVLVVGTTNKVSKVDIALRRSLRLGMHLHFGLPSFRERAKFFTEIGFDEKTVWAESLDAKELSAQTEGLSGADIVELIGLAKQEAFIDDSRKGKKLLITIEHFEQALDAIRSNHGLQEFEGFGYRPGTLQQTLVKSWENRLSTFETIY